MLALEQMNLGDNNQPEKGPITLQEFDHAFTQDGIVISEEESKQRMLLMFAYTKLYNHIITEGQGQCQNQVLENVRSYVVGQQQILDEHFYAAIKTIAEAVLEA